MISKSLETIYLINNGTKTTHQCCFGFVLDLFWIWIWIWCLKDDSNKVSQTYVYHCVASPFLLATEWALKENRRDQLLFFSKFSAAQRRRASFTIFFCFIMWKKIKKDRKKEKVIGAWWTTPWFPLQNHVSRSCSADLMTWGFIYSCSFIE